MSYAHYWHVWPGRNWPLSCTEERRFADDLAAGSRRPPRLDRPPPRVHVTAVLSAIRCGLDAAQLCEVAPGLSVESLNRAYQYLEKLRAHSEAAWSEIVADPTLATLRTNAPRAALIRQVPVYRLLSVAQHTPDQLAASVAKAERRLGDTHRRAHAVEDELATLTPPSKRGVELGRVLLEPFDPGLWDEPHFAACRVGELTPNRVRDLLGER
jgi:hypothetical protein